MAYVTRLIRSTRQGQRYLDYDTERFFVVDSLSEALTKQHRRVEVREAPRSQEVVRRVQLFDARDGRYLGTADTPSRHDRIVAAGGGVPGREEDLGDA